MPFQAGYKRWFDHLILFVLSISCQAAIHLEKKVQAENKPFEFGIQVQAL